MQNKTKIISPCNKNCKVIDGVCSGCYRTYDEVVNWLRYTDAERVVIHERCICEMESKFPLLAASAFAQAKQKVLGAGLSVLESEQGVLYEVFPDGTKLKIKDVPKPTAVVAGSKIQI